MPREPDDRAVGVDIVEAARSSERYLAGADLDGLPSVPWSRIARMRDKLIHHYEGRDVDLIREVAVRNVPDLRRLLEARIPDDLR